MTAEASRWNSIWSAQKTIEGSLLNLMGLQVGRTVAARLLYHARRYAVDVDVKDAAATLRRDGIVVWPDFLSRDRFERVKGEFQASLENPARQWLDIHQGPNTVSLSVVRDHADPALTATCGVLADPRLLHLLRAVEKRPLRFESAHHTLERLAQGPGQVRDPESELHIDTFFSCHKAWLYLTDVDLAKGPFVYVKGSHRISASMLLHQYKASLRKAVPRFDEDSVARLGLHESVLTCPANTLVVANVTGFHRRLRGQAGNERRSIHTNVRCNPFDWRVHQFTLGQPRNRM